jgi:hypothetical protein
MMDWVVQKPWDFPRGKIMKGSKQPYWDLDIGR